MFFVLNPGSVWKNHWTVFWSLALCLKSRWRVMLCTWNACGEFCSGPGIQVESYALRLELCPWNPCVEFFLLLVKIFSGSGIQACSRKSRIPGLQDTGESRILSVQEYRGFKDPRSPGHTGVENPWCLGHQRVIFLPFTA